MAGDWIKMRADLLTHPKVVRITSALKADRLRTCGGLLAVWCLFDAHSVDGKLDGYTLDALDDLIGWPGFAAEMERVGWLVVSGDSLETPRFDEHNGQSAKRRAQETQRKRVARAVPEVSASDADKLRSREEKRREEEKEDIPPASRAPRAVRKCPASFEVDGAMRAWAVIEAPNADVDRETAKFRDHTFKTGITDWLGAWRNWVRRASDNDRRREPRGSMASFAEQNRRADEDRVRVLTGGILGGQRRSTDVIDMEAPNAARALR